MGVVWTLLLSTILSPLSPSLWETARYRLKYCLKGPLNPGQPTNQPTTICIYRVYITILSVFVSIVHGVCLYSISGPFLFYALKPFALYNLLNLLCYKRFHWLRKINQVSSPDRLTSYVRKTNTKTRVIISVIVKYSCIHRLSLSLLAKHFL